MSYDDWQQSPEQQWDSYGEAESIDQPPRSPGKRTLTMNLPPRTASAQISTQSPVQQKADPTMVLQRKEQAALTAQWMDVAVRPDLHDAPVQRRALGGKEHDQTSSTLPADGSGKAMPEDVQAKMEGAFGADFSAVRIHEGPRASAMGALAFTQGSEIHFAPGQYQPGSQRGQELLGHELTHVVQQSQGRVGATTQAKGVAVNDDAGLEREADEMGARAARDESSPQASHGLIVPAQEGSVAQQPKPAPSQRKIAPSSGVVQMAPQTTHFGRFIDTVYNASSSGVEIQIDFEPGPEVDAKKIGMTQSIRAVADGHPIMTDPSQESRYVAGGPGEGYRVDRVTARDNPIYGADSLGAGNPLSDTAPTNAPSGTAVPDRSNATYELGYRYVDSGSEKKQNAWMYDAPTRAASNNSSMTFETTALALEGAQQGSYYGSVKWGWERDGSGTLRKSDFAVVSQGAPSQNFLAAAAQWNSATTRGTVVARNAPTQVYKLSSSAFAPDFTIAQGTRVTSSGSIGGGGVEYRVCTINDGPSASKTGYIQVPDLRDQGDGGATVDLPVPDVHVIDAGDLELNEFVEGATRTPIPRGTRCVPNPHDVRTVRTPVVLELIHIEIVDGPLTGQSGYIRRTALRDERP